MLRSISIIIPLYNEETNVMSIYTSVHQITIGLPQYRFNIIMVDDGSKDDTLACVQALVKINPSISYISFSRNFGKDNALLAGVLHDNSDAVITLDADLQHPPELIPTLIKWWEDGFDVVYTYRENKNSHADLLTQIGSKLFYKITNKLTYVKMEDGLADYRLIDKKVIAVIKEMKEDNPFFRGLLKWVGFNQKALPYTPVHRSTGKSKYNYFSLLKLAFNSILSFSVKPLTLAVYLGFIVSTLSLFYLPYIIISFHYGKAISGWASTIATIALLGGIQLIMLGIIGIYLGKIFVQTKKRPRFIIQESKMGVAVEKSILIP